MGKVIKMALILAVICAISAAGLSYVYLFTKPQIEQNAKVTLEKSKQEVLGSAEGKAISVSPRGYGGAIDLLVGVSKAGEVLGIKVLSHKETPGLGANAVKPAFLKQFIGKTAKDSLEPKKDIDAITGATITSRAVCSGVKEALKK